MKEHVQKTGVRKYAGDDLIELQAEPLKALQGFLAEYGACIIQGVEVIPSGNGLYNVTSGLLALAGIDADEADTFKVAPFTGVENVTLPLYLTLAHNVVERPYGDGKVKPIAYDYRAAASATAPENGVPYMELTATGGQRFVDAIHLTDKLNKDGNGKDVNVTFAEASERVNITSGEKLSALFGKIRKWFAGLAAVAFSGKSSDLETDTTHRLVTDAEKTTWSNKAAAVHTHNKTDISDFPASMPASDVQAWAKAANKPAYTAAEVGAAASGHNHTGVYQPAGSYAATSHTHSKSQITDFPASMPASDVQAWAKAANKPAYTAAEVGAAASGHNHAGVYQPAGSYAATSHTHSKSQITDFPASMPASDVPAWAKATNKPAYTAAEVGAAASGHNHAGVYQPAGSYAAASHGHAASAITEEINKRFMTDAERSKLAGLELGIKRYARIQGNNGILLYTSGNLTIERVTTGKYKVTHNLGTTQYGVIGTGYISSSATPAFVGATDYASNTCTVYCYTGGGGVKDADFSFIIF